ncbi:MAG TPA: hypothetical protein PKW08_01540 [Flavobacteriaceae bacterium]|nr:hypothetical protein [Flavobacteriaceae bacterium]MCB9212496.1 hypothetical protein [Alteromonas sp.]HPF10559.1 hypothetical protein [Flavobacteriaceae bacterium]HQU20247.1 hypothetical protein [Flavobacteriaceae bacterium]HQU66011.1 hypothetical protein [Flavobacteriaceae bacterium]
MKKLFLGATVLGILLLAACKNEQKETTNVNDMATDGEAMHHEINTDSVVHVINGLREGLEMKASGMDKVEIPTDSLREKIKQKWSKFDFYVNNNQVVRIKAYPHEGISKRTEEFYFNNGQLVLAVIEDDGSAPAGEEADTLDKMYYYHEGEVIKELKSSIEAEYSIKESDAEELMEEAKEYLSIFKMKG